MKRVLFIVIASIVLTACQNRAVIADLEEDKVVVVAKDVDPAQIQAEADKGCAAHNRKAFLINSGCRGQYCKQKEYLFSCKNVKWYLAESLDDPDSLNPEFLKFVLSGEWKLVTGPLRDEKIPQFYLLDKETNNLLILSVATLWGNEKKRPQATKERLLNTFKQLDKECSIDEKKERSLSQFRDEILAPTEEGSYMRKSLASEGLLSMAITGDPFEWDLVHQDDDSFLYENHITKCKKWGEGHSLARVIEGQKLTWFLRISSTKRLSQRMTEEYEQMLMRAEITSTSMSEPRMPILQVGNLRFR